MLSACRILIIDAAPSTAYGRQQPSLFNCGLAAQKTGVIIDVCSLQSPPNAALQQLVQVCGGSYVSWQEVLGQHKAARALQAARPAEALGEFLVVRAGRRYDSFILAQVVLFGNLERTKNGSWPPAST